MSGRRALARRLVALGVRPGVVVGIALPRTPDLVVAVLAVHKAGGAYLALDPAYPAERIRFIVADAAAPLILTSPDARTHLCRQRRGPVVRHRSKRKR